MSTTHLTSVNDTDPSETQYLCIKKAGSDITGSHFSLPRRRWFHQQKTNIFLLEIEGYYSYIMKTNCLIIMQ